MPTISSREAPLRPAPSELLDPGFSRMNISRPPAACAAVAAALVPLYLAGWYARWWANSAARAEREDAERLASRATPTRRRRRKPVRGSLEVLQRHAGQPIFERYLTITNWTRARRCRPNQAARCAVWP